MPKIDHSWAEEGYAAFRAALKENGHTVEEMARWMIEVGFWEGLELQSAVTKFHRCISRDPAYSSEHFRVIEFAALTQHFGGDAFRIWDAEQRGGRYMPASESEQTERVESIRDLRYSRF